MNGITIGSIAANIIISDASTFFKELLSLTIWVILSILIGFIALKSPKLRVILDGQPTILIKKGQLLKNSLKKTRMNIDDLSMLLREQNIFSFKDVDYAILEPNGKISVLKLINKQNVIREDLNINKKTPVFIPTEIIVDGNIVEHNLLEHNLTKVWLYQELKNLGVKNVKDILYAELQEDGSLYILNS
jgi:uncharacterized membrane protein YcaP (DUF421 family)